MYLMYHLLLLLLLLEVQRRLDRGPVLHLLRQPPVLRGRHLLLLQRGTHLLLRGRFLGQGGESWGVDIIHRTYRFMLRLPEGPHDTQSHRLMMLWSREATSMMVGRVV